MGEGTKTNIRKVKNDQPLISPEFLKKKRENMSEAEQGYSGQVKKRAKGVGDMMHGQTIEKREGIKKIGTPEFLNKVEKRRKAEKAARKQRKRKRNRKKK